MLGCVIVPVVLSGETFIGWRWVWHELIFFVDGIFYFTFFFFAYYGLLEKCKILNE